MQTSIHENEHYKTSDLPLVAALLTYGAKIDLVERDGSPRALFHVRYRKDALERLIQAFYNRELLVDPVAYFNALKEAKTRLYNAEIY
jgi:hypothetical protein